MEQSFHLRKATSTDIGQLVKLLQDLFAIETDFRCDPALQQRGLELLLASATANILVAARDTEIVGMVTGQLMISTAEGGHSLLVEDLIVKKEHRGEGLGGRLLEKIGAWGALRGARRIQLLADRENNAALLFYKSSGWQKTRLICLRKYHGEKS